MKSFLDVLLNFFRFALILDHKSKNLILSIRGTASFNDVIIDCVCDEIVFMNGFAHRGILQVSIDSLVCIDIVIIFVFLCNWLRLIDLRHLIQLGSRKGNWVSSSSYQKYHQGERRLQPKDHRSFFRGWNGWTGNNETIIWTWGYWLRPREHISPMRCSSSSTRISLRFWNR